MWIHSSFKNGYISINGTSFLVEDFVLQDQKSLEPHHLSYLENKKNWSYVGESDEKKVKDSQEDQPPKKKTAPKKRRTRKKG